MKYLQSHCSVCNVHRASSSERAKQRIALYHFPINCYTFITLYHRVMCLRLCRWKFKIYYIRNGRGRSGRASCTLFSASLVCKIWIDGVTRYEYGICIALPTAFPYLNCISGRGRYNVVNGVPKSICILEKVHFHVTTKLKYYPPDTQAQSASTNTIIHRIYV